MARHLSMCAALWLGILISKTEAFSAVGVLSRCSVEGFPLQGGGRSSSLLLARKSKNRLVGLRMDGTEGETKSAVSGGMKDYSANPSAKKGITRNEAILAIGLSFIPALAASVIAGQDAPPPEGDKVLRVSVVDIPDQSMLDRRGVSSWEKWESPVTTFDQKFEKTEK